MDKKDYIFKTFSRTTKKDTENYVLTGIWHRLGNYHLRPVTQQYVKRSDDHYALLDLFFPDLNYAIEVDEPHHFYQEGQDIIRMENVLTALNDDRWINCNLNFTSDLVYRVITKDKTIEEIDNQILEVVDIIKTKINESNVDFQWKSEEERLDEFLETVEVLSNKDNFSFRRVVDVANKVFGKNYKGLQRCFIQAIDKKNNLNLWCPKLALIKNGEKIAQSKGWLNELSTDWKYIDENNEQIQISASDLEKERQNGIQRAVFARYQDHLGFTSYRFVGVFIFNTMLDDKTSQYIRVREEVEILK